MKQLAATAALVVLMASALGYVIVQQRADKAEILHRLETIEAGALFLEGSPIWERKKQ